MWIFAQVHVCHAKTSFSARQSEVDTRTVALTTRLLTFARGKFKEAAWCCCFRHIARLQDTVDLFPAISFWGGYVWSCYQSISPDEGLLADSSCMLEHTV